MSLLTSVLPSLLSQASRRARFCSCTRRHEPDYIHSLCRQHLAAKTRWLTEPAQCSGRCHQREQARVRPRGTCSNCYKNAVRDEGARTSCTREARQGCWGTAPSVRPCCTACSTRQLQRWSEVHGQRGSCTRNRCGQWTAGCDAVLFRLHCDVPSYQPPPCWKIRNHQSP